LFLTCFRGERVDPANIPTRNQVPVGVHRAPQARKRKTENRNVNMQMNIRVPRNNANYFDADAILTNDRCTMGIVRFARTPTLVADQPRPLLEE